MPAIQYPFIDIAVHPRVRERFARGEAMALFSTDLSRVLWANGAGADLFGHPAIYDFLDQGAASGDVSFRQIEATARQLGSVGDTRSFLIRMTSGFQRVVVNAAVEMIRTQPGEDAILFSAPVSARPLSAADGARRMLDGFDDPDTHMAVIGRDGEVIASSSHFSALGITPQTARMLVTMAGAQPDRLIKRPIPTGQGYLPAAMGRLSENPALHLLFVVETVLGHLDPVDNFAPEAAAVAATDVPEATPAEATAPIQAPDAAHLTPVAEPEPAPPHDAFVAPAPTAEVIDAVAGIEDVEEAPADIAAEPADAAVEPEEADHASEDLAALAMIDGATAEEVEASGKAEDADPTEPQPSPAEPAPLQAAEALVPEPVAEPEFEEPADAVETVTEEAAEDHVEPASFEETVARPVDATTHAPEAVTHDPESATMVADEAEPAADHADAPDVDAEPEVEAAAEEPEATPSGFTFKHNGRATRFVWKIDAEGRFSEISREFAEAVGPHAADVAGMAFSDVASRFNLDPEGKIAALLERRDTWSGRTIQWPVEGTGLTVPVDLAALPTYTRSREFDGFRGFGVVRVSDAAEDPMKYGLALGPAAEEAAAPSSAAQADDANDAPVTAAEPDDAEAAEATVAEKAAAPDEMRDEVSDLLSTTEPPALEISETPNRRLSDKIIQLHEHRMSARDGLSATEQAAFREIARQLEPFGKRTEPPVTELAQDNVDPAMDAADMPAEPAEIVQPAEVEPATESAPLADLFHTAVDAPSEAAHADRAEDASDARHGQDVAAPAVSDAAAAEEHAAAELPADHVEQPASEGQGGEPEEHFNPLDVLSTAIPPRVKATSGLDAEVVDLLPVAILIHAGDRLIHANPEFLRLTGYRNLSDLEAVGGLDALLQQHDLEEHPGAMVALRADDVVVPVTARLQSIRWEDASALMLALMPVERTDHGAEALLSPDQRDESRPERMLEKVAKLQVEVEELQSILETATDGVVVIGPEGEVRSMNRSASALFNYDEQETRGRPFVMLFAHESQKAVLDYLAGLSGHGVASVLNDGREVIGREASGGFVPLFMTMGKLTSSNGYCAVIRDITQWKRTEDELRNAKRAAETANAHKSDFLARVSHEIRTPLNAIIGFSDMMAGERFGPIGHSRYVEYANDIGRSGRHVLDIVNDLLDISKIEAGEMDLEFGSVGLNEAIAEAVSLVQPQANSQRVIIRTALSQSVPNVVADLRSIKQIALNILSNAIRFTPSGGQIVVSTSYEANGSVVLRIRDTGTGMTRSELEQAMKPFRQVSASARNRGDGTGLGLPLTKAMVDANRAVFSIHSAPNEGTLVEITFPSPRVLAN